MAAKCDDQVSAFDCSMSAKAETDDGFRLWTRNRIVNEKKPISKTTSWSRRVIERATRKAQIDQPKRGQTIRTETQEIEMN